LPDQPHATARTGRSWRLLLLAVVLAGLAVVLLASSALSSSPSAGSPDGTPAGEQVQQTPGPGDRGHDCPKRSGGAQPSPTQDV
jgi:hypothetical protein